MGICNGDSCCKKYELIRTLEANIYQRGINGIEETIYLNNGKSISSSQLNLNKQYLKVLNDIRENPSNYINESKSHNLFDIFIKLKPSNPLRLSENNLLKIICYLEDARENPLSYIEKEEDIKKMINNGNVENLCLFQTRTLYNDIEDNFWYFLEENEDDIDKILTVNYDYIMIICLPIENDKSIISFVFYDIVH